MLLRSVLLTTCTILTPCGFANAKVDNHIAVKVNPGKYNDYYHIQYELTSGHYRVNQQYGFNQGGQFEVFVDKQDFPIRAPNCQQHIIIRMPYSTNEEKKRKLYQALMEGQTLSVTLELNPYVKRVKVAENATAEAFELTYCNVFFRHRAGDYFNQL